MASTEARLELVVDCSTWWLRPPAGEPLNLQLFGAKQADALQRLLSQRHPLSEALQKRIRAHDRHRSTRGFCCQIVVGLCLPAGLLTQGEWDYDRDMDVLRKEAAAVLSTFMQPASYELLEHIDSEAAFAGGKCLFYLYVK
ncbi:hypothetical protein ABPG75_000187 [Micractinium tetrahymenae]